MPTVIRKPCILCLRIMAVLTSIILLAAIPEAAVSFPLVAAVVLHSLISIHRIEKDASGTE